MQAVSIAEIKFKIINIAFAENTRITTKTKKSTIKISKTNLKMFKMIQFQILSHITQISNSPQRYLYQIT